MGANEPQQFGDAETQIQEATDGFNLVIEALKQNGIDTIFGLPGIPITDLTRRAQGAGMLPGDDCGNVTKGAKSNMSRLALDLIAEEPACRASRADAQPKVSAVS